MSKDSTLGEIAPFFIVKNLAASIDFYNQKLGFKTDLLIPEEDPFFGIVSRDNVRILLKHITEFIHPVPNHIRHEWATTYGTSGQNGMLLYGHLIPTRCLLSISHVA